MNVRKFITLASVALALWVAGPAHAQTSPKVKGIDPPKSVLYVGNSFFYFNDSMHHFVGGLLAAAEPQSRGQYRATSVTISGSGLNWHDMEAYFNPGMASYSFTEVCSRSRSWEKPAPRRGSHPFKWKQSTGPDSASLGHVFREKSESL